MKTSQSVIFEAVYNFLFCFGYHCKRCSEVIKIIYTDKTPDALGCIGIH